MERKFLETLEYPKVLAQLAQYTSFSASRELALQLDVTSDLAEAERRQRETSEARSLLGSNAEVSLGGVRDVRPLVERALRGLRLLPQELLDIQATLEAGRPLSRTLGRMGSQVPLLAGLAARIQPCTHLINEIKRCITPRGEVADAASPELAHVRAQLALARERLLERLERFITGADTAPCLQEPLITQRSGRYVIPVKAEYRNRIPGIVHDESASGATLFIEPLSAVALNNELREWQLREEREVARVLDRLTGLVAAEGEAIVSNVEILAQLDLIFARARYAQALRATQPRLVEFGPRVPLEGQDGVYHPGVHLRLLRARHPLLPADVVVPIDVQMALGSRGYFIIVITGPNTGGKTVALKTIGLLCLMAQAGLHIPAAEGSTLCVFDGIYADIGDEQSIEQSLSTFSSHMGNIVHILARATERSLVLLDELGAGTDPIEGSALARAVLSELLRRGITTVATTHHPELKIYAQTQPGVVNASVEFDAETLAPTYELTIGMPGRSNAFAIAERLGLPRHIVAAARQMVDPSLLQSDEFLREVQELRDRAERRLQEAEKAAQAARAEREELAAQLAALAQEKGEILEQARLQARQELEELRREIARARSELARARAADPAAAPLRQAVLQAEAVAEAIDRLTDEPHLPGAARQLRPGDLVRVPGLNARGVLTAVENGHAEVQAGGMRLRLLLSELEPLEEPVAEPAAAPAQRPGVAAARAQPELHLRGLRADEAEAQLLRYLDEAFLAGLRQVRIVHGKGSGVLRRLVRQELSHHPLVVAVRAAPAHEGGEGVTIAELAVS